MDLSLLKIVTLTIGYLLCIYGAAGLLALWLVPELANSRLYGRVVTGRLPPTHRNRAMMLLHQLLGGAFIALASAGYLLLSSLIVPPFLVLCFGVLRASRLGQP